MSKTLATILVLAASSTAAMAAPMRAPRAPLAHPAARQLATRQLDRDRDFRRPIDRGPGTQGRRFEERWRPIFRPRMWEHVAHPIYTPVYAPVAPVVYSSPFVDGQMWLSLGGATGSAVELTANGGSTFVQQVVLRYENGTSQVVPIGRELDAASSTLAVPTDGCALQGVTVIGWGTGVSAYAI
jgi:hypothetical protein